MKSRIVSNNDELSDYVALHLATVLPKLNASANFMGKGLFPVKLAEDSFTGRVD